MSNKGKVVAVNIFTTKGEATISVPEIIIDQRGIIGDAMQDLGIAKQVCSVKKNTEEFVTGMKNLQNTVVLAKI